MPSPALPHAPKYRTPPTAEAELEYADLPIIDLSKAQDAKGRAELTAQMSTAMQTRGFFYAVNHGYTASQTERMFDIADVPFTGVDPDEKRLYIAKMKETGAYRGYKPRQYWHIDNGVRDQAESYNVNFAITKQQHPEAVRPFLAEIETFARHCHLNVVHPILRLLALGLELPEDALVEMHGYSYPRSQDEELKTKNVWLKGHTDTNSITVLYSQPVINVGDALEFLTGGYYKATIHRVVQPPADQRNYNRLGLVYFAMTDDAVKLAPLTESPVLQHVGIVRRFDDADAPTMEEWRKGRISVYGQTQLKASDPEGKVEEEVIHGVVVKHYN
ncbi:hypothetical protein C8R47DRAFT_1175638 [Mycena vitilis]|nr:hypothetical protein C8R47DRAFT_1175638 [Mycena vitilis]